jgi:hypothetical protein
MKIRSVKKVTASKVSDLARFITDRITLSDGAPSDDELQEEAPVNDFPDSFDMDEFNNILSFKGRVSYCDSTLNRIAAGSSRIAYGIDNEKTIKVAYNTDGLNQNYVESNWTIQKNFSDIVTKLYSSAPHDEWIVVEKAIKVHPSKFATLSGIEFKEFASGIKAHFTASEPEPQSSSFLERVITFIEENGREYYDFAKISTYGVVKREGKEQLIIVDFGY